MVIFSEEGGDSFFVEKRESFVNHPGNKISEFSVSLLSCSSFDQRGWWRLKSPVTMTSALCRVERTEYRGIRVLVSLGL